MRWDRMNMDTFSVRNTFSFLIKRKKKIYVENEKV